MLKRKCVITYLGGGGTGAGAGACELVVMLSRESTASSNLFSFEVSTVLITEAVISWPPKMFSSALNFASSACIVDGALYYAAVINNIF